MLPTDRAVSPEAEPRVVTFTITPTRERPLSYERDSASAAFDVAHVYAGVV